MVIRRDLIEKVQPFLKRKEFISIVGPRQSGKTTFLHILRDHLIKAQKTDPRAIQIITFEDRKLLMQFEKDPVSFVRSYVSQPRKGKFYLMIDEFQYARDGGQKLKLVYDTMEGVKVLITGSSSLDIKANTGKFMVGRLSNFTLYPFNFRERLRAKDPRLEKIYTENNGRIFEWLSSVKKPQIIKDTEDLFQEEFNREYEDHSIWGGYPAVILAKSVRERAKLLADIYNNYILRDIKSLLELATEKNLFLLSQYLATQIGNIAVYQNLCMASQLDYRRFKKHLGILEETFICKTVRPFFRNRQKELSKNPKIFFMDMGFRNNLMENMNTLDKRSDAGGIIENSVFIRLNELYEGVNKINFWRTKAGAEVDFILHTGEKILPIEVKYTGFRLSRISKSFMSFIDSFKPGRAAVLTKNYWGLARRDKTKILFAPAYYL